MVLKTILLLLQTQAGGIAWSAQTVTAITGESVSTATGSITVAEHHDRAGGGQIRLPILRLAATTASSGPPIVYLAGGPGVAGIPTRMDFPPLLLGLRASGDVILYDQRGTGQATPSLVVRGRLDLPSDQSLRGSATEARLGALRQAMLDTLRARSIDPNAYTTAESVADLEALRIALGAPQLVLWGHSYGSHLALAYLKRYPTRVARLMIGGVNGPDQRWRPPLDGDRLFARIDSVVRTDVRMRAAMPDFLGTVRRVRTRLQTGPIVVPQDGKNWLIGWDEVATTIALQSNDLEFIKRLPQIFAWLDAGDVSVMARIVRATLHERPLGTAMSYTMHLASGASAARRAVVESGRTTALLGNAINWPWDVAAFASGWGVADLGDLFRAPVQSPVPALLYSGTFDGRTSIADAEEVLHGLSNGVHVIVDGAGHNAHQQSPALTRAMLDFVAGRKVVSQHLREPLELRGPHELEQIAEIQRIALADGGEAAAKRLAELALAPRAAVTSYVAGTSAVQLMSGPKRFSEAVALLEGAVVLFSSSAFLHERLGDGYLALTDSVKARAAYSKAASLDSLGTSARAALVRLEQK